MVKWQNSNGRKHDNDDVYEGLWWKLLHWNEREDFIILITITIIG